jgi:hypothetical protein
MEKYNGWTNYATWRVNLEFFDGCAWLESMEDCKDLHAYAETLKDMVSEALEIDAKGLAFNYAMAFISDVNWHEIAQSMIDNYQAEEA